MRLLHSSFGKTVWFFVASMLLVGLSWATRFNVITIPRWKIIVESVAAETITNFPPELELVWDQGELRINISEPLTVSYPTALPKPRLFPETFLYLVPTQISPNEFERRLTPLSLFVITPTQLYVNDLQNQWSELLLQDVISTEYFQISKESIGEMTKRAQTVIITQITIIGILAWIALPIWLVITQFFSCFVMALMLTLIFKLYRLDMSFLKSFQLTLHVAIVAESIHQVSLWLYPETTIPMYSLTFWLIIGYLVLTNRPALHRLTSK